MYLFGWTRRQSPPYCPQEGCAADGRCARLRVTLLPSENGWGRVLETSSVCLCYNCRRLKVDFSCKEPVKQNYVEPPVGDCISRSYNAKDAFFSNVYLHFC